MKHSIADQGDKAQAARKILSTKSAVELLSDAKLFPEGSIGRHNAIQRLENMPSGSRTTYIRAMKGKSLASAVKAFCMECVGWQRVEVRDCTAHACPLYPYRPSKTLFEGESA